MTQEFKTLMKWLGIQRYILIVLICSAMCTLIMSTAILLRLSAITDAVSNSDLLSGSLTVMLLLYIASVVAGGRINVLTTAVRLSTKRISS